MRYPYSGFTKDQNGRIIQSATVSVYLAGTTTAASVYAAASGGAAVNSVTSDDNGQFTFYVDAADYPGEQLFKIVVNKAVSNVAAYANATVDNIHIEKVYPYEVDAWLYGNTYTQATIEAALTAIGTTNKVTLLLRPGTWVISSNADWSAYKNITWKIVPGAYLKIASGKTVTINGTIGWGLHQVFSLDDATAKVLFSAGFISEVYPEWWGGRGDGSTDNTAAIKAAIVSLQTSLTPPQLGGTIKFQIGTYLTDSILVQEAYTLTFEGSGKTIADGEGLGTIIKLRALGQHLFHVRTGVADIHWINMVIDGNNYAQNAVMLITAVAGGTNYSSIEHVQFRGAMAGTPNIANVTTASVFAETAVWRLIDVGFSNSNVSIAMWIENYGNTSWWLQHVHFDMNPATQHIKLVAGDLRLDNCYFDNAEDFDIQMWSSAGLKVNDTVSGSAGVFLKINAKTTTGITDNWPVSIKDSRHLHTGGAPTTSIIHAGTSPLYIDNFYGGGAITITGAPLYYTNINNSNVSVKTFTPQGFGKGVESFMTGDGLVLTNDEIVNTGIGYGMMLVSNGTDGNSALITFANVTPVTAIVWQSGTHYSVTKDNVGTINIYLDAGTGWLCIQNKTGGQRTLNGYTFRLN